MSQKKFNILFLLVLALFFVLVPRVHAQMMGSFSNQPSVTPTQEDIQDIQTGKDLYNKFQNKQITCNALKDDDFEKIGEYIMNQRLGNIEEHIQMNNTMKQMMGEQGEENVHTNIGRATINCIANAQSKGGVSNMMGWGGNYGYQNMMNSGFGWGFGILGFFFWIVLFIDLVLLGIFLWKKIRK